jgi:hypothetical protein
MVPQTFLGALVAISSALGLAITNESAVRAAQVESMLQACGFATTPVTRASAGQPGTLPWVVPPEAGAEPLIFFARDSEDVGRPDGRLFTVLIFPDSARATSMYETARARAATAPTPAELPAFASAFRSDPLSQDRGPMLVQGAGPSFWKAEVVAFQLLAPPEPSVIDIAVQLRKEGTELAAASPEQVRSAIGLARAELKPRSHDDLGTSPLGVDRDFADCLNPL